MLRNFMLRQLMTSKLKDVPQDQQEQLLKMVEKNPELFKKIALTVQAKMKEGKKQQTAMLEVLQLYRKEFEALIK